MDNDVSKLHLELMKRLRSKILTKPCEKSRPWGVLADEPADTPHPQHLKTHSRNKHQRRRSEHHAFRHRIVQVLVEALLNPICIEWDVTEYASIPPSSRLERFPLQSIGFHAKPATLVDLNGIILMWYLPGLLPVSLHTRATRATLGLNQLLADSSQTHLKSRIPGIGNRRNGNWRISKSHLVPKSSSRKISGGAVNFSGGWFAQGHASSHHLLRPSHNLRTNVDSRIWLSEIACIEEYINSILALTHPTLYNNARLALDKLRATQHTVDIATIWPSIFTGIAVIANRITPSHTDRGGRPSWYDTLLNIGTFATSTFRLPDLGAQFAYPPGTIINICGNILKHQVNGWGDGDRVCYAHFMRDAVLQRLEVGRAGWVRQSDYEGLQDYLVNLT